MSQELIVTPGRLISAEEGFMRGHGTVLINGNLYATVAGVVEKINKLVCVTPLKSRYLGDIGDVVIGRIAEVGQKKWKVDIGSYRDATLQLSAITLPGGIQRRKQESDERQMRSFFNDGEIVCAEVQLVHQNDSMSIHTRNYKYGKLCTGILVTVTSSLIRRSRTYFHSICDDVEIVIGLNGMIWVGKQRKLAEMQGSDMNIEMEELEGIYSNTVEPVSTEFRQNVARIANCIYALEREFCYISIDTIKEAFHISLQEGIDVYAILQHTDLVSKVKHALENK